MNYVTVIATQKLNKRQSKVGKLFPVRCLRAGIRTKDALHVAAAIAGRADAFITTDDKLLGRLVNHNEIRAVNPIDIVGELHEHRTDEHIH
ncbi:MAG: hypothetical protein BECKG1743D_GA0114223_100336 [Candidatus Kentron sp. G]|nr:MAG: hypothetical protein BECKG1743F_GA0114225_100055 [Candidatus Kentron sp. G]VFM96163.1 MAG: hypothetical protein BECKG1743E_GA0114224_100405 [Candidatus Kentron sp. G]VFM97850.1 MAG: hypothetical protein BECKG1743D_GA0114223_100336 [Candidatus Kentron sp. G]